MMSLPEHYTRLAPFLESFRTGAGVLMYHHVGPRKRGARLKGLYVSLRLFARQLTELKSAGFSTAEFREILGKGNTNQRIFLTIDDGFSDVFEYALPVLRENGFRAILYLVSDLIGKTNEWQQKAGDIVEPLMNADQIRAWLEAGQEIGAHTQTHPWLTQLPLAAAREEITACKKNLEDRFGLRIDHFCYPYGDWNESVRDLVISAGYKTACTTHVGVNTSETSPFELKRFMARYPSRNLRTLWRSLRASVGGH